MTATIMERHFQPVAELLYQEMVQRFEGLYRAAGVVPIPEDRIPETAFFPGSHGIYLKGREREKVLFPDGGIMVLGHNFDSECAFRLSRQIGDELAEKTWIGLDKLLRIGADIQYDRCFFTNAFMGLCEGDKKMKYLGRRRGPFRDKCRDFLVHQIETQRPRLILTIGVHSPPLLGSASPTLKSWEGSLGKSDPELSRGQMDENPIIPSAVFRLTDGTSHNSVVVPLTHPCNLGNSHQRRPKNYPPGMEGEIALIKEGWKLAQIMKR